jgi:hypothetical protein
MKFRFDHYGRMRIFEANHSNIQSDFFQQFGHENLFLHLQYVQDDFDQYVVYFGRGQQFAEVCVLQYLANTRESGEEVWNDFRKKVSIR